jgi:plasmid stabilization system protein ParE
VSGSGRGYEGFPYVIYYTPVEDGVEIERVLHGARDVDSVFGVDEEE